MIIIGEPLNIVFGEVSPSIPFKPPAGCERYKLKLRPSAFATVVIKIGGRVTRHYVLHQGDHLEAEAQPMGTNQHA